MYKNPNDYFVYIGAIIIGLINLVFIFTLIKAIISCYTSKID